MTRSSGSSLTSWLATPDEERLARVLRFRPDTVTVPEPQSLGEVADRLQRPASVLRAIRRLSLPCLQVGEAVVALGGRGDRDALTELLGRNHERDGGLDHALTSLADHALVWPNGAGKLHMASALHQVWPTPLGLDRPFVELLESLNSEDLRAMLGKLKVKAPTVRKERVAALLEHFRTPDRVMAVVAETPAATRELLEEFTARDGRPQTERSAVVPVMFGSARLRTHDPARWAVERGLLVGDRHGYRRPRMPAEVTRALRGPDWRPPFTAARPVPRLTPVTAEDIARETASTAGETVTRAASVLHECAVRPPTLLKSGGVGVRELGRIARAADCEEPLVRLVLECAAAAGLLAREKDHVLATHAYDTWTEQDPADQLTDLLRVWWTLPITPTTSRDDDNKALPALSGRHAGDDVVEARRGLLTALDALSDGHGVAHVDELGPLISWHRPLAIAHPHQAHAGNPYAALTREATLLGVLALGAPTPLAAALTHPDRDALAAQARQLLPPATASARFGSDLTAVVLGTPTGRVVHLLDTLADREARGTASLWRFTGTSLRRALDAGHRPEGIEAELTALTDRPLPQPLTYLIKDTARRHGHLRVTSALCVLHGQDPALLAEIAAHRKLARLGLRQLAPTVLTATAAPNDVLASLRAEGYAPVAETATGELRLEKPSTRRASKSRSLPGPRRPQAEHHAAASDLRTLATRLLNNPIAPASPKSHRDSATQCLLADAAPQLSAADRRQLAHAIDEDGPVTIAYTAASGADTVRTLSELALDPPFLYAWCHLRDDERVFALSRIQGVLPD